MISSFSIVSIWFVTLYLFRWQITILAPLLLLFEPHLDLVEPILTFLVFISVAFYYIGATRNRIREKIAAYITLGLATTIDPGSVFLYPAFILFSVLSPSLVEVQYDPLSFFKSSIGKPKLGWTDAWGVVLALVAFFMVDTSAWQQYRPDLPINATGQTLKMLGEALQGNLSLIHI